MASNSTENVDNALGESKSTERTRDDPKYQAELPQLIQRSDYISDPRNGIAPEATTSDRCYPNIFTGLPLPLMRICSPIHDGPEIISGVLVPGLLPYEPWSDDEKCSLNLGLHIFEKNFDDIRRFVKTKKTVDILSYYYGEFYGSAEYIRWSERRKEKKKEKEEEEKKKKMMKKKKKKMKKTTTTTKKKTYVEWNEVFSGIRHQELISRLGSGASGEIPRLKIFKTFPEDKTAVLDYVLCLKDVVGIKNLAKAIAIGDGEKDLTRTAFEHPRKTRTEEEPGLIGSDEEEAEREPNEDRNDEWQDWKRKQVGSPFRKRRRRLTAGNHEEPRDGGIGCSKGPRSNIGPSCQSPARDKSPPAGPSNGSPRRYPVGNARPAEPSPDNFRVPHLFDLNNLPQASEESEQDNEPIMPDNSNGARNDELGVVDMNPLRHSTRIRPRTPKGKSYGDSMANNRKRKGKPAGSQEGSASRPSRRARGGARPNGNEESP